MVLEDRALRRRSEQGDRMRTSDGDDKAAKKTDREPAGGATGEATTGEATTVEVTAAENGGGGEPTAVKKEEKHPDTLLLIPLAQIVIFPDLMMPIVLDTP